MKAGLHCWKNFTKSDLVALKKLNGILLLETQKSFSLQASSHAVCGLIVRTVDERMPKQLNNCFMERLWRRSVIDANLKGGLRMTQVLL